MAGKIALLSNVNMNFVIRMLQKDVEVYEAEGYGNELGTLMNPASSYHAFAPEITFVIEDLMELLEHDLEPETAKGRIDNWFAQLEGALQEQCIYYVSDAYLWGVELGVLFDKSRKCKLEQLWQERLERLCEVHANVRSFPYRSLIEELGEANAFSLKMWYMGRILHGSDAQKSLCQCILDKVRIENSVPKKVLLLDLDNTLWGGLAGEADHTPIVLSEEHSGLAYKNLQRVILQMQKQGVLLGIVSKNNEEDVNSILAEHPHMVLRPECFAIQKVNWKPKHENIQEIAEELNLGLDSFVFFDDNAAERQLIQEMLPQVAVPDFPDKAEDLAGAMTAIYQKYFAKAFLTGEDLEKTKQYADNVKRNELKKSTGSFADYLKQLAITMERVDAAANVERLTQLVNKTNQFNLTTKRYTQSELQQVLGDEKKRVYLYDVKDCFGDNGVVAAVIVDLSGEVPEVEEFVMSCRIMGKNIEAAIIEDVEQDLQSAGYDKLKGSYIPTAKNKPVAQLYERLGYRIITEKPEGKVEFLVEFSAAPKREHFVERARCYMDAITQHMSSKGQETK